MARSCPSTQPASEVFSCTRTGRGVGLAGDCWKSVKMEARRGNFRALELIATPMGEPLYAGFGFKVTERLEFRFPDGIVVPAARMVKPLHWTQDSLLQFAASEQRRLFVAQRPAPDGDAVI